LASRSAAFRAFRHSMGILEGLADYAACPIASA
jgi:hypothetical protein